MEQEKKKEKRNGSLILQVSLLFAVSVLIVGVITFFSQRSVAEANVREQLRTESENLSKQVGYCVREYPAFQWLLRYWYEHYDQLNIEYDISFESVGSKTERKVRAFENRKPELVLQYATIDEVTELSVQDQKTYAEIIYTWMITRLNDIKRASGVDYLFAVIPSEDYSEQFFLFSAADEGARRGTDYEEVYPLGVISEVQTESQKEAMRQAVIGNGALADAGNYMDFYGPLTYIGNKPVLMGFTYDLEEIHEKMRIQTLSGTLYAMITQVLLSLVILSVIYFFVIRPVKSVQESIRLYSVTKDSNKIREDMDKIRTNNEISELADDISSMTVELDDYIERVEEITAEEQRVATELSLATRIQASTLPNKFPAFPDRKDFDIYASMDPAKEVGGDFYDFFLIDDDHLGIVMADVSGKGIPAALFMMVTMSMIHNAALAFKNPAEALTIVNEEITKNNQEEMFVTVWLGNLDLKTGHLIASNAGHEYPVIKAPDGDFEVLKDKHGFVIGGMSGIKYKDYEVDLMPGAKLFLYTDGLPEATNTEKELMGIDRAVTALRKYEDGSPKEILDGMTEAVQEFIGDAEQFDDLTMLALTYNGPEAGSL